MTSINVDEWRMNSLGFLVAVLGNDMAAALDERLKELDLKITMWPTLLMLWNEDGLTQTELSERCKTANYTTTRMLDTLEKKGLIERKAHPTSRRAHLVFLTEEGKALKPKGLERAMAINEEYLSVFTKTESETFLQLLNKLVEGKATS